MTKSVPSALSLAKNAGKIFWKNPLKLIGLVAIIAVPLAILGNIFGLGQDPQFSAYTSFLSLIMNVALIWMIVQLWQGEKPRIRDAYYRGTGSFVRFIILAVMLTLMLIPFLIGGLIYLSGISGATLIASTGEKIALGIVWFVFALPSILLIARYFLGVYVLIAEDETPIGAFRRSGKLVKGHTLRVLVRLLILAIVAILVLSLPALAVLSGTQSLSVNIGLTGLQLISTLVVLPFANLYLYGLYRKLADEER
ncbi:MAG: hypothetical protein ACHQUB_03495 [Candidatus Saccharimonadia bacterium]